MRATLSEPLLAGLSDVLALRLGLHFPRERWADLERGVIAAAARLRVPYGEAFAQRLLAAPLTNGDIESLAAVLTVGETYFFREKSSLEALQQHVLPRLVRARADGARGLRIWSAGCCTGEEPYSIVMLLDQLLQGEQGWTAAVHATDVNPVYLRAAAHAEYGEWAFRETPGWIRDRFFQRVQGGRFRLRESIRARVTFASLNLADDSYPAPFNHAGSTDLILCRNVLMYFTAERARAVADKFHHALADDGWLVVSPAETSTSLFSRFTPVHFDGAILYRKRADAETSWTWFLSPAPIAEPVADWIQTPQPPLTEPAPTAPALLPIADETVLLPAVPSAPDPGCLRQAARDCANRGQLSEAAEWCRQAIIADRLDATCYYLLATIAAADGRNDDAVSALSRAVFLEPEFVLAHLAFAHLRQAQGRSREARRHFENAVVLLRSLPPDEPVPESDGLSAGRLAEIVESLLASLPPVAA